MNRVAKVEDGRLRRRHPYLRQDRRRPLSLFVVGELKNAKVSAEYWKRKAEEIARNVERARRQADAKGRGLDPQDFHLIPPVTRGKYEDVTRYTQGRISDLLVYFTPDNGEAEDNRVEEAGGDEDEAAGGDENEAASDEFVVERTMPPPKRYRSVSA